MLSKYKNTFVDIKFLTKIAIFQWLAGKVYNERMCTTCNVLGDEYNFVIKYQVNTEYQKYIFVTLLSQKTINF